MTVTIGGLTLKNPVMTASGTFGYGEEYASSVDINRLGAVVVKGISLKPRKGNPPHRIMETPSGMLNAIGLENPGVDVFLRDKLSFFTQFDVPLIVNIFGDTIEEYAKIADILSSEKRINGLEVNISCPNVKEGGWAFGIDPERSYRVTRAVREATELPVIVKLSPNVTDITVIAESVEKAGADAISLINTVLGMSVDIEKRTPHLGNIVGGLSGPAIKPIALRMVWEVVNKVSIPVIGIGGITSPSDALEFLITGAKAVQVGTANFINPRATVEIIEGIEDYLVTHGIHDVNDIIRTLNVRSTV